MHYLLVVAVVMAAPPTDHWGSSALGPARLLHKRSREARSDCGGAAVATDRVAEMVLRGRAASPPAAFCRWSLSAARGREVLLLVEATDVDCSRDPLQIATDGQRVPDICRRLQNGTVAQPLWGSSVEVRYRLTASETVRLSYRVRADVAALSLVMRSPTKAIVFYGRRMPLARGERTWREVRRRARREVSARIDDGALAYQVGQLYRRGRAVRRCFWSRTGGWRDEVDGRRVQYSTTFRAFSHYLLPGSPVRTCPGCEPGLAIVLAARVVTAAAASPPRLQPVAAAALRDPRYILMLFAIEMTDLRAGAAKLFVRTAYSRYSDAATGRLFLSEEAAAKAQAVPRRHQRWRQLLIVLRHGDSIPRFALPRYQTVDVNVRFGVQTALAAGRVVRRAGQANPGDGTWATAGGDLESAVAAAMRRSD